MVQSISLFTCEICNKEFFDYSKAEKCEKKHNKLRDVKDNEITKNNNS